MRKLIPLSVFAVSFAFVECAVVIYLRRLYYPEGFSLPLRPMPPDVARVEMLREAATLFILGAVAAASGKGVRQKFAYFMFLFGTWDVLYYVWLWIFTGWPGSFFTPDLLFLVPVPWWGPVLAPLIVAASLCAASVIIIRREEAGEPPVPKWHDAALTTLGVLMILYAFMSDSEVLRAGKLPPPFKWGIFGLGEALAVVALARLLVRRGAGGD
ncbi:MAG: hypothetical protein HY098_01010 [Nitrospinae bacterium]|nr:hypothetical protein [Nitrospinota bacterium]